MTPTKEEAIKAQKILVTKLMVDFNAAAAPLVSGVGFSNDAKGYWVNVYLERKPTPQEKAQLPKEQDGVKIKYKPGGPFKAQ